MTQGFLRDTAQNLAACDDRLKTGRTGVRWRPAWRWPAETERFLADLVATCPRPVLHVCAGSSAIGDIKADMFHPGADVRADMYRLPFRDGALGTVLADPPFPLDGVSLPQRLAQFQEMGRCVRKGGVVLLHAPWLPRATWGTLEDVWVRHSEGGHGFPHAAVLLTKWRRTVDLAHVTAWPSKTREQRGQAPTSVPREPAGQVVLDTEEPAPSNGPRLGQVSDVAGAAGGGDAP